MLPSRDLLHVVSATVPLYVTMILAYVSVKWWKLFTPDQCSGINKFVAKFSVPLLSFQVVSSYNLYRISLKLIYAEFLQKFLALLAVSAFAKISARGGLRCVITGFSLSTLPNTLILGIPLLTAMYRDQVSILAQIIVLQSVVWYNLLLFLYEFDAANTMSLATPPISPQASETEPAEEEQSKEEEEEEEEGGRRKKRKILLVLSTVGKKLITNPNTYGTLAGLIWAAVHFRWGIHMPSVVKQSIVILSNGGLGMAMFSLGLFMASQSSVIACGTKMAVVTMALKFLMGPALMALASVAVGLRDTLLKAAIVQAALPQGIVPFVFAQEYNVHPALLSTGVILGMLISLPIALAYYFLLAL
ncbi:auxin efflux carrier component 8 isoform X2 [Prosopis cineraria]|uniref:auxin efflux carrier component 8 isoform X2 n=1 Tax=Prosopis cineraria TaxID=364024 RepID=UPI00240F401C|nr:auxin efflux carrier component 8 isoform X2 [Prosopis cineraria]